MPDDDLTLTIRIHDPKEKKDASLSASWVVMNVRRTDLAMPRDQFIALYIAPALPQLKPLKLT